tara:strand:- start:768 stop:980 length:213 start_codon:yes stop_codon:yes gene_type:complete
MRKTLFFILCVFSSIATAEREMEEVKVTARPFRIMLEHISMSHKYNVITKRWYYVATKQTEDKRDEKEGE